MKTVSERLISGLNSAEERIFELKDLTIETFSKMEKQSENNLKKNEAKNCFFPGMRNNSKR